jgi:dynein heavy chain
MISLFRMSSEQLSIQKHYDFGMRAVKTVLLRAGSLLRTAIGQSEEKILIKALKDTNIPKFLDADLPIFNGILHDIFPGVESQASNYALYSRISIYLLGRLS